MKKALISPSESPIQYISSWTTDIPPQPIIENIINSCRIAEVADQSFDVALPLFWVDCEDNVTAHQYYYDTNKNKIFIISNKPNPNEIYEAGAPEDIVNVNQTIS